MIEGPGEGAFSAAWAAAWALTRLLWDWASRIPDLLGEQLLQFAKDNPYIVGLTIFGIVRAMGTTVQTGTTGVFFSFGRARREVQPGFVLMLPFVQKVRTLPTRSRTLDLPDQKVTTLDGLVWHVDVNLVFRIVDVRSALIEVDDLDQGMVQMLGLSVQDVLRASSRTELRGSAQLDTALEAAMEPRLAPWGVVVVHAGFTSIRPSPRTLRLTQLQHTSEERRATLRELERGDMQRGLALPMVGTPPVLRRRAVRARDREWQAARRRRARRAVQRAARAHAEAGLPVPGRVLHRTLARLIPRT